MMHLEWVGLMSTLWKIALKKQKGRSHQLPYKVKTCELNFSSVNEKKKLSMNFCINNAFVMTSVFPKAQERVVYTCLGTSFINAVVVIHQRMNSSIGYQFHYILEFGITYIHIVVVILFNDLILSEIAILTLYVKSSLYILKFTYKKLKT